MASLDYLVRFNLSMEINMTKNNKVKYNCSECSKVYLEHDENYTREYPVASIEDRDRQWWEHWTKECSMNEE